MNIFQIFVKGFYRGKGMYAIRFLPQSQGEYHYAVHGIVEQSGTLTCSPQEQGVHGLVVSSETHFAYQDGTPYYPFGTTVYALAHQPESVILQTLQTLSDAPFNKVRCCVFPKSYDYNHNEPDLFPFEKKEKQKSCLDTKQLFCFFY